MEKYYNCGKVHKLKIFQIECEISILCHTVCEDYKKNFPNIRKALLFYYHRNWLLVRTYVRTYVQFVHRISLVFLVNKYFVVKIFIKQANKVLHQHGYNDAH